MNSLFLGLTEFLTNIMPFVIGNFYIIINLYNIRSTVVKSVDIEMIRQRRNSDTNSNDNFYPHSVIIEELKAISFLKLILLFFNINVK